MAHLISEECEKLTKAFSGLGGLGVEEKGLVSVIGNWRNQPEKRSHFRRGSLAPLFTSEGGGFERWEDDFVKHLKAEFARFKNVVLLWAMHPWERDARWAHHVLHKDHPFTILVEISCTRSSEELLGARKAYHSLFHRSLEEDVAYHVKESNGRLLVGLASAYRYEGSHVNEDKAKSEAKALNNAIKKAGEVKPIENHDVIRILTTRSKPHLKLTFNLYKEMYGKSIEEDLADDACLLETVQCLNSPPTYFCKIINQAFKEGAHKIEKEALNRVLVSRSETDMTEIKEVHHQLYGAKLEDVVATNTHGNYRDALLSLINGKE
ncbi:uncharacterized protein A4U43_C05F720 [Asparagus officinalis]|uniref:Annexin n=1 Tax=Asparagus officinalis TaxID=4686 RepID=A0A5P1EPB9_ASPOF|nr:annexin D4-like [Asparagus officinalis]ONK67503.1 uncharacterized protein A4U43_C05F720 [Asparagus officinalis]